MKRKLIEKMTQVAQQKLKRPLYLSATLGATLGATLSSQLPPIGLVREAFAFAQKQSHKILESRSFSQSDDPSPQPLPTPPLGIKRELTGQLLWLLTDIQQDLNYTLQTPIPVDENGLVDKESFGIACVVLGQAQLGVEQISSLIRIILKQYPETIKEAAKVPPLVSECRGRAKGLLSFCGYKESNEKYPVPTAQKRDEMQKATQELAQKLDALHQLLDLSPI